MDPAAGTEPQPRQGEAAPARTAPAIAGLIDSRQGFQDALIASLDRAAQERAARQLWLCDTDFATWPLGQPAVLDALARWARPHHRLTLLGADYRGFAQRAPRWMAWRRQWSHIVQCLQVHEEVAASVPSLLFIPGLLMLRLQNRERYRGRLLSEPLELARCGDLLDALSQRAEESLPPTTLGL